MEVKRTEMEIFKTKQTYYDDLNQNSYDNFWKLLIALCVVLIVTIVLITCYHYIHGKIIYICKRCFTWRNKRYDIDDNFFVIKSDDNCCTKRRFFWPKECYIPKSHMKYNDQNNQLHQTKSCVFRTPTQEKKKLLDSHKDKAIISDNNIVLTKQLVLKLSALSSRNDKKIAHNQTLNNRNVCNKLCTQRIEKLHQNSHKDEKSICFSDTDLKFLRIPVSSKRCNENRKKTILSKWDPKNTNNIRHDTSSKLIELACEDRNSFNNNKTKYEVYASKSNLPCSFVSKNIATDSISDLAVNKSDILANSALKQLQRLTISYTGFMVSDVSNAINIKSEATRFMYDTDKTIISGTDKLQSNACKAHSTKMRKLKSLMDIPRSQTKEINSERKVKSEDDITVLSFKNENTKNYFMFKDFISIRENHIESPLALLNHSSEANEIYDELGILFSQYMKLQIKPCKRKYCIRSRHLKRIQHSIRKCHVRFNYREIYPHDQRPACNCGNICEDTYDELKLMSILPLERKNIYHRMVTRRKQFLNQPCILINQEFTSN